MAVGRRRPRPAPRISGRPPEEYAQDLQDFLRDLEFGMSDGIPVGFQDITPEAIEAGAEADPGEENDGWASASHIHDVNTAAPSNPTGTAAAEGSGAALMRADATIQQGIVTTKGDLLTHSATVPARLPVGANGTFLQADSAETTGLKWNTISAAFGYEPVDLEYLSWIF